MKGCDHDVVYSGQINLDGKFAYICRRCGECGWDSRYVLAQVDGSEYYRARVAHGWAGPRLPAPPRVPSFEKSTPWRAAMVMFNGTVFVAAVVVGVWCQNQHRAGVPLVAAGTCVAALGLLWSAMNWSKSDG
jgi:hypothetical protein